MSNFAFVLRIVYEMLSGFRDKFLRRVTCVFFSIKSAKQIRKLPKILKSAKIIHYYSLLFIRVLRRDAAAEGGDERAHRRVPVPHHAGGEDQLERPGPADPAHVGRRGGALGHRRLVS